MYIQQKRRGAIVSVGSRNEREWHRGSKKKKILKLFDCAGSMFEVYKKAPNLLKDLSARDNNLFRRLVSPFKHEIPQ